MNSFRRPVLWLTEQPAVRALVTRTPVGRRVAGRFVAGDTLESGMRAAHRLNSSGTCAMLDLLGENVGTAAQAEGIADAYVAALKRVHDSYDLDCNISVKLTQLGLDISHELCVENIERVLQVASERSTLVMIDMESHRYVDPTLELYLSLRSRYRIGVCLQAYLYRSSADAFRIGGPEAIVRMAKGAYHEPPEVAFTSRADVRTNYARLSASLLASGSVVHFATHDERLVEGAKAFVRSRGVPRERYEFQMLYGIRRDLQQELVNQGEPVRVYVPYGDEWYPYLTRRLAERPANVWFFLSNALRR